MLFMGLVLRDNLKNKETTQKIKKVFSLYFQDEGVVIERKNFFLISGRISKNDIDACFENKNNIIIGRVFNKEKKKPLAKENLNNLQPQNILSDYWGKYVFFSFSSRINILRDPTGQLSFFYHRFPDRSLLFSSEIAPLRKILGNYQGYNWPYLASSIVYNDNSISPQTAFEGIQELPPGCLLDCESGEINSSWNPFQFNSPCQNYASIPQTLNDTLSLWNDDYDHLLINLSGGLDSTSLAYGLKETLKPHQTLRAINFFHPEIKSTDETKYAEKVCQALNLDLIKLDMSDYLPFSPPKNIFSQKPNRPSSMLTHVSLMEKLYSIVKKRPSSLLLSGQGGDHLFLCPPSETMLIDYYRDKGFYGMSESFQDLAHYYRTTFYQIAKGALYTLFKHFFSKEKQTYKAHIERWMTNDFKKISRQHFVHPRYENIPFQKYLGKFLQIESIDHGICSIALELGDHNPIFSPLLYQPMVELALSIPVYDMLKNGYDRYPFRKSVSEHFKTDLVWRRSKGETTGLTQLGIKKNFKYVQSLCLDGLFAQKGFIKRDFLESHLKSFSQGENRHFWSLMNLISTEMFFEIWQQ